MAGPKGDKGDQGDPGQGGGSGLDDIKSKVWGYPTTNGVAIYPDTAGESIAIKSSQSAALRWHIRDGGSSVVRQSLELLSINNPGTDGNIVTFNIDEQEFPPPVGYHYNVSIQTGDTQYSGSYISTASTTTTLTLDYLVSTDSFDRTNVTGSIYLPSVYNQVEARQDGVWIKNANWSEDPTYSNNWQFTNDGSIHFPYGPSNQRTGSGDVLKFASSFDQSIIMGPKTTESSPTANRLVIAGADGFLGSTGEGGDLYLWAGRGGDAGGTGGDIKVDAGNGELTGEGGTVKVRGGYSPEGAGGFVEIRSGDSGTGNGGPLNIYSGQSYSGAAGGDINIVSRGNMNITSDDTMTITSNTGNMQFFMDGGMYIGPVDSSNQIIKRSDLDSLPTSYFQSVRWTPNFTADGLAFTGTGTTHPTYNSYYVKQGQLVSFWIAVDLATVTNFGTGQLKLELPFAPLPGTMNHFSGWVFVDETQNPDLAGHIILNADHMPNTQVLDLHYIKQSGGANSPVMEAMLKQNTPVVLTTATNIYVNGTYIAQGVS